MDPFFTLKSLEYQIIPYVFPGHLTHVLQPLDVGVFQAYKHWHRKAVQHAIRSLDIEYNISSFFRDLNDIRTDTFKPGTIQGAFREAGIWPINVEAAIQKMKVYQPPDISNLGDDELPQLPQTPRKFSHAESSLNQLQERLRQRQLSSPTRQQVESVCKGTKSLLLFGELNLLQLTQSQASARNRQKSRTRNRQVLQKSGALTIEEANARITQKEAKAEAEKERRRQFLIRTTQNKIKGDYYRLGVEARRQERLRLQRVKELSKVGNSIVPPELLIPIPDPEKALTEEDLELQLRERLITMLEFSGVEIPNSTLTNPIDPIDPMLDSILSGCPIESQQDYISFGDSLTFDPEEEIR